MSNQIQITSQDVGLQSAPSAITDTQVADVLNTVYMVAGIVAVIVIIIGGIRYTTSNGDAANVKSAKNTILYAVIGLIVIIMAAAITQFVVQRTTANSGGNTQTNQQTAQPQG